MPLLPEGVDLYKSLQHQVAISKRTVDDLRNNLLSQEEPIWGTVSPDSLKVQTPSRPLRFPRFAGGQAVTACCLQACAVTCMFRWAV